MFVASEESIVLLVDLDEILENDDMNEQGMPNHHHYCYCPHYYWVNGISIV